MPGLGPGTRKAAVTMCVQFFCVDITLSSLLDKYLGVSGWDHGGRGMFSFTKTTSTSS